MMGQSVMDMKIPHTTLQSLGHPDPDSHTTSFGHFDLVGGTPQGPLGSDLTTPLKSEGMKILPVADLGIP